MRIELLALVVSVVLPACMSDQTPSRESRQSGACVIGGCAAEVCAEQLEASPCIFLPVNTCYQTAMCGRQPDGTCGWDPTPELTACIASYPDPR
jgi:hypothetical protein